MRLKILSKSQNNIIFENWCGREDEGFTSTRSLATDLDTYKSAIDIVSENVCLFDQSNKYTYETLERRFYRPLKDHPRPPSDISS